MNLAGKLQIKRGNKGGILWMRYPKRTSRVPTDPSRDAAWDPPYRAGRGPVAAILIHEVWSGLKIRVAAGPGRVRVVWWCHE